jgi:hypothetical protein
MGKRHQFTGFASYGVIVRIGRGWSDDSAVPHRGGLRPDYSVADHAHQSSAAFSSKPGERVAGSELDLCPRCEKPSGGRILNPPCSGRCESEAGF